VRSKDDTSSERIRFLTEAREEVWKIPIDVKSVQVIKDTKEHGKCFIQFGTEVVSSEDNSVIALLGESPGASVSVSVVLEVFRQSFPEYTEKWETKLKEMIPSYGQSLIEDSDLLEKVRKMSSEELELK